MNQIAILRQIARALNVVEDLSAMLERITLLTTQLMRVDSCSIYLLDPDGETLRLQASTGLRHTVFGLATLQVGEGMTGQAILQETAVHAADAINNPYFKPVTGSGEQEFQSLLATPLIVEERPIGALNVQTTETHYYSPEEIDLLSLIGDVAAGTIHKAQLYEKQRQQLEELQALAQISEAVTSPRYLDDMLDVVTDMAARTLNAAVCSIFLLDEEERYLELRSAKLRSNRYHQRAPHPVNRGVIGRVVTSRQELYVENVQADELYSRQKLAKEEGLISLYAVPLSVRERVIGVLACYTTEKRRFSQQDRSLLQTLANQTALAIENAQMATNAAIIKEMHHRIKNNLQTVAMLMRLQMSDADRLNNRELLEMSISRIQSIAAVHEILSERGFHMVEVRDVLQRIVAGVITAPSQNYQIEVLGEALTLPSKEATSLALAVNELIQNGIEHGFAGRSEGHIWVTISHAPQDVVITVRDNGQGIPDDFDQNLGLELVGMLIREDLKGSVSYNRLKIGTEVVIRLPKE